MPRGLRSADRLVPGRLVTVKLDFRALPVTS